MKKDNNDDHKSATKTDEQIVLENYLKDINKKFGVGTVRFLHDDTEIDKVKVISTGSLKIDELTGIKGLPEGRIIEIFGKEGSGKTTLALTTIAEAQKLGYTCMFVDVEHALNTTYARQLSVKTDKLILSQPNSAEEAFDVIDKMIHSGAVKLIVVDSVSALVPQAEIEMSFGENVMAGQARFMSSSLRRLISIVSKADCAIIFLNQIRHKVGVMFGNPETTTGGVALKFYASMRLEISKKSLIKKDKGEAIGQEMGCTIIKNKFASPYKSTITSLIYGEGFNRTGEIFDLAVEKGIIVQKGAWYAYGEDKIGQGKDACIANLESDNKLKDKIFQDISKDLKTLKTADNNKSEDAQII